MPLANFCVMMSPLTSAAPTGTPSAPAICGSARAAANGPRTTQAPSGGPVDLRMVLGSELGVAHPRCRCDALALRREAQRAGRALLLDELVVDRAVEDLCAGLVRPVDRLTPPAYFCSKPSPTDVTSPSFTETGVAEALVGRSVGDRWRRPCRLHRGHRRPEPHARAGDEHQ